MTTERPSGLPPEFLRRPTRFLFFTGKGGVGKTSLAAATALSLADAGRRVLLVSTDAASNLDEMLGVALSNQPVPVPDADGLSVLNIDPQAAAQGYRRRVLEQMSASASDADRAGVLEQLSGACTTEIAAFDEFAALLADGAAGWDHVIFDTAPTGHTLRLLSLPGAWTGFLGTHADGASCLGPHSGLKMQLQRFQAALQALSDPQSTTVILVARPDALALSEAARTADELRAIGLSNQRLVINGVFRASRSDDPVARAFEAQGQANLRAMPDALRPLPRDDVPLRAIDNVGLAAIRSLLAGAPVPTVGVDRGEADALPQASMPSLDALAAELAAAGHGLVMVMGKGGVGKTTVASALALELARLGHPVHLSTTDPAAHVAGTLAAEVPGLRLSRIDPKAETARYVEKIVAARSRDLDAAGIALLREDLRSPCTEEVAVFHAFSRVVGEARQGFVVLDTAPTGHSLLLMDATGAYHRQTLREFEGRAPTAHVVTPLMRLQDPAYTRIVIVTLPEPTPVSQAASLQDDLRRAGIEPCAWVLNRSLLASGTTDPLLQARLEGERRQVKRIQTGLARRLFVVPWLAAAPVGVTGLTAVLHGDGWAAKPA